MKAILIGALCLLFGFQWATAQSGILDPSFDGDGMAFIPNIEGSNLGTCAALTMEGDIILGGTILTLPTGNPVHVGLAKLHADGSLDTTFNTGIFYHPFGDGSSRAVSVKMQSDGKIVVAFEATINGQGVNFGIARFLANGTLDTTFGNQGWVSTDILGNHIDTPKDMLILSNGKIILGGFTNQFNNNFHSSLGCYLPNGTLDPTFGTNGIVVLTNVPEASEITNMASLPNGEFMVGGRARNSNSLFSVARFQATGQLDSTFSTDGIISFANNNASTNNPHCLAVQPDGKTILGGYSIGTPTYPMVIARIDQSGNLDAGFGINGIASFPTIPTWPQGITFGSGGTIYVGGKGTGTNGTVLHRLRADGSLDSTFGLVGTVDLDMGGSEAMEYCMMQPDGKILIGGSVSGDFGVARFLGESVSTALNESIKPSPLRVFPNPLRAQATVEFTLAASEIVSLSLLDITGREMCVWVEEQPFPEGVHYLQIKIPDAIPASLY